MLCVIALLVKNLKNKLIYSITFIWKTHNTNRRLQRTSKKNLVSCFPRSSTLRKQLRRMAFKSQEWQLSTLINSISFCSRKTSSKSARQQPQIHMKEYQLKRLESRCFQNKDGLKTQRCHLARILTHQIMLNLLSQISCLVKADLD